jgi:hypothetical protein
MNLCDYLGFKQDSVTGALLSKLLSKIRPTFKTQQDKHNHIHTTKTVTLKPTMVKNDRDSVFLECSSFHCCLLIIFSTSDTL